MESLSVFVKSFSWQPLVLTLTLDYVLQRKQATDSPIKDRRGKETHNKTPKADIERVRAHIDFPSNAVTLCQKRFQPQIPEQQFKYT